MCPLSTAVHTFFKFRQGLALSLLLSIFFVFSAKAANYGGVGGSPANPDPNDPRTKQWLIYTLQPGESVEDAIVVKNTTSEDVVVKLYPADYVASTDGGFALEQEVETRDEVGSWVELSETLIPLPPSSEATVPFKLTVPNDPSLDVGEHMGGILIQQIKEGEGEAQGGLQIQVRTGVRIYVTIPGEVREELEISQFGIEMDRETRVGVLSTSVKNSGNVSEAVLIRSRIEHKWPILDKIFPKLPQENERSLQVIRGDELISHFEFELPWLSWATFSAEVEYTNKDGEVETLKVDSFQRWILPPKTWLMSTGIGILIGGVCALLLIVLLLRRAWKRRKARKQTLQKKKSAPKKKKKRS